MSFCVNCGSEIKDYEKFCSGCGYPAAKDFEVRQEETADEGTDEEVIVRVSKGEANKAVRLESAAKYQFKVIYLIFPIIIAVVFTMFLILTREKANKFGNTFDNIQNGGKATIQGKWIYYCTESGLYKMRNDGGDGIKLADGQFINVNVIGDWIYSTRVDKTGVLDIYKIRTDGSEKSALTEGKVFNDLVVAVGKDVYFQDENNKIGKMKTDGSNKKDIFDFSNGLIINMDEHKIYILRYENIDKTDLTSNPTPNIQIYTTDREGRNEKLIFDEKLMPYGIRVKGKYVYYVEVQDQQLVRYDIETKSKNVMLKNKMQNFNIQEHWVYYKSAEDGRLWKVKIDGTENTRLSDEEVSSINVVGDWVIYSDAQQQNYYRIKTDGKEKSELK